MNDELTALLEAIGTEDAPTDEQLSEAKEQFKELLKSELAADDRDLEAAAALRAAIDQISAEEQARVALKEADDAKAAELLEGIDGPEDEEDESEESEEEAEAVEVPEAEAVAVAASVKKAVRKASARVNDSEPEPASDVRIRAVGAAQGYPLGQRSTMADLGEMFAKEARGSSQGPLVHVEFEYPEDRRLTKDALESTRIIDAVLTPQALSYEAVGAAGGICGPLPADFTHPVCGDRSRPIRDGLPRFNANRGGVRFAPAVSFADLADGITVWPIEMDESPGENTKDCLVLECEDEVTAEVDAIVACVQIGNFQAKFNPEFWRSRLDALMVAHDRIAEQTLLADIVAGTTAVTYATGDGTIYSVLSFIDKATAGIRSRLRLNRSTGFRAIMAEWVRDAFRSDIVAQRLFGLDQLNGAVDSYINSLFTVRGVTPIWSQDIDVFGTQAVGALNDYPGGSTPVTVFPEGTFMFLDGGTLDLGTEISDSTLNATNDRQAFMETFEKAVFRGCEGLTGTVPIDELCICPDVLAES